MGKTKKSSYSHQIWNRPFCQVVLPLLLALIAVCGTSPAGAQEEEPATETEQKNLPDIRARTFDVSSERASRSGRVYLMNDLNEARPFPGRILLLREGKTPIIAFRVLRNYSDQKKFAARVVRKYPGLDVLPASQPFMAIEKVSDLGPLKPTREDRADLRELERGMGFPSEPPSSTGGSNSAQEYDPELDAGTSPPPSGDVDSDTRMEPPSVDEAIDQLEEEAEDLIIDEIETLDPHRSSISVQYAMIRHIRKIEAASGASPQALNSSVLVRYGLNLGKMILIKKHEVQDAFTAEAGIGIYNYGEGNQAYSIMPTPLTLRYTINFNNNVGVFVYGGVLLSRVIAGRNTTDEALNGMNSSLPAAGIGVLGSIGPSWNLRFEAGYDTIGFGLMLSF